MSKVSIALRGWRFDEDEVFDEHGAMRPLREMSNETRTRIIRLSVAAGQPCDACWLEHGRANVQQCNVARVIYGEPLHEVLLCADHEPEFLYWFREAGGRELADRPTDFEDEFYEWFDDGNRAPEDYGGMEYVNTEPEEVPKPQQGDMPTLEEELAQMDDEELDALDVDLSELDFDDDSDGDDDIDIEDPGLGDLDG